MRTLQLFVVLVLLSVPLASCSGTQADPQPGERPEARVITMEQKVTMASLRAISTAIEEYSIDNGFYPRAGSIAKLEPLVVPRYTDELPQLDGWGGEFEIDCIPTIYTVASCGKGHTGVCNSAVLGCGGKPCLFLLTDDIILVNGSFVQWPEVAQE